MPKRSSTLQPSTARLFMNGSSQAVRLPRAFRFSGDSVGIRREGESVILEPLAPKFKNNAEWFAEIRRLAQLADEPILADGREQSISPDRKMFD